MSRARAEIHTRRPRVTATTSRQRNARSHQGKPMRTTGSRRIRGMRNALVILAVSFAVSLATSALAQQQDFSKVQMKVIRITDHAYMLQGAGGNIGVSVGDDGIVIIDDEFAPLVPKIREALKAITTKPVKYIINTHYHGDHT